MARSSYIYIVFQKGTEKPIATFTVKHEMVTWIKRNRFNAFFNGDITGWRYPDGGWDDRPPVEMDLTELMGD